MTTKVNAAVASTVRGGVQYGAGYVVAEFIDAFHIINLDGRQYAVTTVVAGAVLSFLQNAIENKWGKALFKKVPVDNRVPVIDKGE